MENVKCARKRGVAERQREFARGHRQRQKRERVDIGGNVLFTDNSFFSVIHTPKKIHQTKNCNRYINRSGPSLCDHDGDCDGQHFSHRSSVFHCCFLFWPVSFSFRSFLWAHLCTKCHKSMCLCVDVWTAVSHVLFSQVDYSLAFISFFEMFFLRRIKKKKLTAHALSWKFFSRKCENEIDEYNWNRICHCSMMAPTELYWIWTIASSDGKHAKYTTHE